MIGNGQKWPKRVLDAIAEAVARGERHGETLAKLRAGTLPGLERSVQMPERTFSYHWTKAKREQEQARRQQSGADGVLERIARAFALEDQITRELAEGKDEASIRGGITDHPEREVEEALSRVLRRAPA